VLSTWPCNRRLDAQKVEACRFGSTKWFWPKFFCTGLHAESGKLAQQSLTPLLLLLIGWIVELIDPGGLLLVPNLPPIWSFSFMGGVGKKVKFN
jgi:hypothetical protein